LRLGMGWRLCSVTELDWHLGRLSGTESK
jgi:hypothetical protein